MDQPIPFGETGDAEYTLPSGYSLYATEPDDYVDRYTLTMFTPEVRVHWYLEFFTEADATVEWNRWVK